MTIVRLHHVQITIPPGQEAEARKFCCGLLGLVELEKPAALQPRGGLWLQVGSQQVHIGTEGGVERMATKAHLAYEVADLAWWRSRLEASGVRILDAVAIPECERFEFRDPFGNRVEFVECPKESSDA